MSPLLALSWIVLASQDAQPGAAARAGFQLRCLQGEIILDSAGLASGVATLRVENPSGRIAYWLTPVFSLTNHAGNPAACIEDRRLRSGEAVQFDLPLQRMDAPGVEPSWAWQGCFALPQHPENQSEDWEFVAVDVTGSAAAGLTIAIGAHAPDLVRLGAGRSWLNGLAVEAEFFEHVGCPEIRFTYRNATDADLFWTPNPEGCTFGGSEGPDRWRDRRDEVDGRASARLGGVGCSPLHVEEAPTLEQIAEWRMAPGAVRHDAWFWDCMHWTAADGLPYADGTSRMMAWGRRFEVARPSTEPPATRGGWKERQAHVVWSVETGGALSYRMF